MTNASIKSSIVLSVITLAIVASMGAFASVAHAQDWGDSYSFDGGSGSLDSGGWGDSYSYDGGYNSGNSWADSYSYDGGYNSGNSWADSYSYDGSNNYANAWGDSYSYDGSNNASAWGDAYSYDGSNNASAWGDAYSYDGSNGGNLYTNENGGNLYTNENGGNLYTNENGGNLYTNENGGNLYTNENGGNLYTNENGGNLYTNEASAQTRDYNNDGRVDYVDEYMRVTETTYEQQYQSQGQNSYGGSSSNGGQFSYGNIGQTMSGYSMPRTTTSGGCSTCHYTTPQPQPCYTCNQPTPPRPTCAQYGMIGTYPNCTTPVQPHPVCPSGTTGVYPNCVYPQPRVCPTGTTGVYPNCVYPQQPVYPQPSNNYCVNNSCNTHINESYNSVVTTLGQVVPQRIVDYVYPYQTVQPVAAPYCVISVTQNGAYATLTWTSTNAYSARLSSVGNVAVSGTTMISSSNQIFTLTVTGQGGSATCQTRPMAVAQAPYVSLSQIPYTGLDLGVLGNAMYWMGLIAFAAAGAYLIVYYQGGALALATNAFSTRSNHVVASHEETHVVSPVTHEEHTTHDTQTVHAIELPTMSHSSTKDTMTVAHAKDGMPRLVINRN